MSYRIAFVFGGDSHGSDRVVEIKDAIVELGHEVVGEDAVSQSEGVISFSTTPSNCSETIFPVEKISTSLQQFCETHQYNFMKEGEFDNSSLKTVTAYSFYAHTYPLIVHGPPWQLEVVLDRKEALKFRYMINKYQSHFSEESLIEYQVAMNNEYEVFLQGIKFNTLVESDDRLELAISRSGLFWIDLVEEAITSRIATLK